MAFSNFRWAWNVRGLSTQERLVLLLLADQADGSGHISRLSHATIRARCGFSYASRHSKRIIAGLMEKGFIVSREPRHGAHGNQVSNAYQIDLERLHPVDGAGKFLWETALDALRSGAGAERLHTKAELHAEGSTSYYATEDKTLVVWVQTRYARQFFYGHLDRLLGAIRENPRWPVERIELLALDS